MLVIGDKERDENLVAVRSRVKGDMGSKTLENFIEELNSEIKNRKLN